MYSKYIDNNKKQTVVFIHPFPASSHVFLPQLEYWNSKYNTLLIDLPGFGASRPVKHKSLDIYVNKVRGIVEKYQLTPVNTIFYGMSFGGIVSIEYCKKYKVSKLLLESVPLSTQAITTNELEMVDILKGILVKTRSKDKFENLIKHNKMFQSIIMAIYKLLRPKTDITPDDSEVLFHLKRLDLDTLFWVGGFLENFSVVRDINALKNQCVLLYDKKDPTVSYKKTKKFLKREVEFITTNFKIHAPGSVFSKEVAQLLLKSIS